MATSDLTDCTPARTWLSAARDGEAPHDPVAAAHVGACVACAAWAAALDVVEQRIDLDRSVAPDVTSVAVAAFDAATLGAPRGRQRDVARVLLAVAGCGAVVLAALGLTDAFGTLSAAGTHIGRELYAFEAALGVGFLMAAWRPHRYAASLLPMSAVVGLVAVLPSAGDLGGAQTALREATHLPVLIGLGALLLLYDATRERRAHLGPGRTA